MGWPKIFMARSYHVLRVARRHAPERTREHFVAGLGARRNAAYAQIVSEYLPHAAAACDIAVDDDRAAVSRPGLATSRNGSRSRARVRHRATDLRRSRRRARVLAVAVVLRRARG